MFLLCFPKLLHKIGINASLIKKLQEAGYYTVESVIEFGANLLVGRLYYAKEINRSEGS